MKSKWLLAIPVTIILLACGAYFALRSTSDDAQTPQSGGFSGVVVDALSNAAVPGATITASCASDACTPQSVTADEDGSFSFDLEDGNYQMTVVAQGYVNTGRNDRGRTIEIANHTRFVNGKLKIWPEAAITGRIIAGSTGIRAHVVADYQKDASGARDYTFATLDADENGAFLIEHANAGVLKLAITYEGFADVELQDLMVQSGQTLDLGEIPLLEGVSLYGIVSDATSHKGIPNARVALTSTVGDFETHVMTDASGHYRLPAVDLKQVQLQITSDDYRELDKSLRLEGSPNQEFNAELKRMWGLTLTIENKTGRNESKTYVKITDLTGNRVVYDEILSNGTFSLDTLKGGPFLVDAESFDHMTRQTLRVPAGEKARIHLKPYARIVCSFLNSDGSPMESGEYRYWFRPYAQYDDSTFPWKSFTASTLEIDDLVEGFYKVGIKKGDREVTTPEFQLHHGDVRAITLQMTEGGVLNGHVVSTETGFNVRAKITLDGTNRSVNTDRDGYFTLDKLPKDTFTLVIVPNREERESRFDLKVEENGQLEREFKVSTPKQDERMRQRDERRRFGPPPNGKPPWGDGEPPAPPWDDGEPPAPPWGDGEPPAPPWGDGDPPWGDGEPPTPPWGDGDPPWGDGEPPTPPWGNGDSPRPPTPQNRP